MAFSELPLLHYHSHHILAKPVCFFKKKKIKQNKLAPLTSESDLYLNQTSKGIKLGNLDKVTFNSLPSLFSTLTMKNEKSNFFIYRASPVHLIPNLFKYGSIQSKIHRYLELRCTLKSVQSVNKSYLFLQSSCQTEELRSSTCPKGCLWASVM